MAAQPSTTRLLHASVDEDDESYVRLLCEGKRVKYVTIAQGLYSAEDMCFEPALLRLLPELPPGKWNEGYVDRDAETGNPCFTETTAAQLPGIQPVWHPTSIDQLMFDFGKKLHSGIYEATNSTYPFTVVTKFARFPWEIDALARECRACKWIEGQDIGPQYLANLTEDGRVIGFVMEHIPNARHASPTDLESCERVLSKLHQLGILHGDVNKHNFLLTEGRTVLIDFDTARKCEDAAELDQEMKSLKEQLADTSGRGGRIVVVQGS